MAAHAAGQDFLRQSKDMDTGFRRHDGEDRIASRIGARAGWD